MNFELPNLKTRAAADETASRSIGQFRGILLGIAVVVPWLLLVMSIMSGNFFTLTLLDLIGTHLGLWLLLRGYRDDNRVLKIRGAWIHAVTLLLCLVGLAVWK
ncbi:hypothetical protein DMH25_16155 [Streptomyces sp. WAC 01325]|uniref:hypothetical protein n=1 Tax=Streptomyces TaxID=1883 RepID=UPI000F8954D7|nr:hypothetical protein [Streptomyces sp. WAC 01325]RSN08297.1 hypothetical protein DMH25_16155 [Streptomyces sp. WAC 01325]WCH94664.1 hypothetical protein POD33_22010 [Streptomyces moderatus]